MYRVDSEKAEEFINHQEVLDTLEYARANKNNHALIEQLITKAAQCKGLTHREAALLLECDQPELTDRKRNQTEVLRQPHCNVCTALSLQLLRQRLYLLPLSPEE